MTFTLSKGTDKRTGRARKTSVVWYDTERDRFRVAIGRRQNTHIGRFKTLPEALAVSAVVDKAYEIGYEEALKEHDHELEWLRERNLRLSQIEALGLDEGILADDNFELDY